jgi:hypothetical protein
MASGYPAEATPRGAPDSPVGAATAVVTRDPACGRKFDKVKSTGRIDALVALAMALSLVLLKAAKPIDIEAPYRLLLRCAPAQSGRRNGPVLY